MPEYAVLDKYTIKSEIMPYLSVAKRGFTSKFNLEEIVNAILYKLKSGCQWRLLPTGHLFSGEGPSWQSVFLHYRKWCRKEEWRKIYSRILSRDKNRLDLSISHIDGSHTPDIEAEKRLNIRAGRNDVRPMPSFFRTIKVFPLQCLSLRQEITPISTR